MQPALTTEKNNENVTITLNWDDWPATSSDFDVYLFDKQTTINGIPPMIVGNCMGQHTQTIGTSPPTEQIDCTVANPGTYYIFVNRKDYDTKDRKFKIFSWNQYLSPATAERSLVSPADADAAITVGAIHQSTWTSGFQTDNSSQWPTMDDRTKPNIMGPDQIFNNFTYPPYDLQDGKEGSFRGTSAAAPHVAGAASLIWSANPGYTLDQLRNALMNSAVGVGVVPNYIYGWGRLKMPYLFSLQIYYAGSGTGTINYSLAGTPTCGVNCNDYYSNTPVTLTAVANAGSIFTGWSGEGCSGTGNCVVTMSKARNVTGSFAKTYNLAVSTTGGTGFGAVTSTTDSGISCGTDCSEKYVENTIVSLIAAPSDTYSYFSGWAGACSGTGSCTVTMDAAKSVTAIFKLYNLTVTVQNQGATGSVTSTPTGIS